MFVIMMVMIGILCQWITNKIAIKNGYGFGGVQQWTAIVLSAFFWGYLFYKHGTITPGLFIICLASTILISTIFVDYRHYIIPNGYSLLMLLLGVGYMLTHIDQWKNLLLGGIVAFLIFLLLMVFSGGNLGGGDVKLSAGIGLFIGLKGLMMYLMLAFLFGAFTSLALLMLKIKDRKDNIPFGPYMSIAFLYILL